MHADNTTDGLAVLAACTADVRQWYLQNGLQLNPDKSEGLAIGTATQLHAATSTVSSVSVAGADLTVSDEMKVLGVLLDRRLSFDSHARTGSSMQLPSPSHPSHPASTDDRTRSHTGVQSDTVSTGLLQRCVEWSSNGQYSEAAARAEHCSADRPPSTARDACSATTRTFTLATGSTADRLQAGRANVQSTQLRDTIIPQPSDQTKRHLRSSSHLLLQKPTTMGHISPIALFAALHLLSGTL